MYSKAKGITEQNYPEMPLPPGYRGNRFRAEKAAAPKPSEIGKSPSPLDFIKDIDREELLIITLIIVLAGEGKRAGNDTLFVLILLLLVR